MHTWMFYRIKDLERGIDTLNKQKRDLEKKMNDMEHELGVNDAKRQKAERDLDNLLKELAEVMDQQDSLKRQLKSAQLDSIFVADLKACLYHKFNCSEINSKQKFRREQKLKAHVQLWKRRSSLSEMFLNR